METDSPHGIVVPILTPLTPGETVDAPSLRRLVNYLLDHGVHGIWAAGTNGEFAALPDEQRVLLFDTIVDEVAGRVPIIANISASSTQLTVDLGKAVQEMRLDGVAATPPYYYPCSQTELLEHFRYIRERVGLPLWVYNIPATVKTVVEPDTIARLATEGTVVGVKDSSGAGELLAQLNVLLDQSEVALYRFLGSMYRIAAAGDVGAHGITSGMSNFVPGIVVDLWNAGQAGDRDAIRDLQGKLIVATKVQRLALGASTNGANFAGYKAALAFMGIIDHDTVTRPFRTLTEEEREPIPSILTELGLAG